MAKRPPPIVEVVFVGAGILPETIPFPKLSRTLSAVQRLAVGREPAEEDEEIKEGAIQLLGVKRGSAAYQFAGDTPDVALTNLRLVGRILSQEEEIGEKDFILNSVEEISSAARSLGCEIIIREPGKTHRPLAKIGPASYENISHSILVTGDTTFVGVVERAGGATERRCALRVDFQHRLLYCGVESNEIVRKLGQYLYQKVVVHGVARWLKSSWKVYSFTIREVSHPKEGSIRAALKALHDAGGSGWDEVEDPKAYLEEVTGER
jgi:hypothetical protein